MVLAEGSTPDEAVNLSLITRPLLEGGRGGVERARLDWDFKPDGRGTQHGNPTDTQVNFYFFPKIIYTEFYTESTRVIRQYAELNTYLKHYQNTAMCLS